MWQIAQANHSRQSFYLLPFIYNNQLRKKYNVIRHLSSKTIEKLLDKTGLKFYKVVNDK